MTARNNFRRILVIRTDRIGDVVLSTPVLKALRDNYPQSHIAIMVSPQAQELVEGNPYINEVIVYDKDKKDRGIAGFLRFVIALKKKRFDLAILLHTKKRTNLITYFANIPRRIGYHDKKFGFLLTDKIEDTRGQGLQHEVEYCLDIVRELGLKVGKSLPYVPLSKDALKWVERILEEYEIKKGETIIGIHPGASCISKRWLKERFIFLADKLIDDYRVKVIIVASGADDIAIANDVAKNVRYPVVNLAGKTTLVQLAALLKRCAVFISNDSGPVHIASSVATPVISIFGRNQAGLSPVRWGPLGERDTYLHKEVGCSICLAHKCTIGFDCLKAITVDDVLKAVDVILKA